MLYRRRCCHGARPYYYALIFVGLGEEKRILLSYRLFSGCCFVDAKSQNASAPTMTFFSIWPKKKQQQVKPNPSKHRAEIPMPSFNVIRPLVAPFAVVSAVALLSHYPELVTAQGQLHTPPSKSTNVFTQAKGGGDFGRSTAVNAARARDMKEMLAAETKLEGGTGSSAAAVLTSNKSNGKEVDDVTKAAVRLANAATGKHSILDEINEVTSIVDRKSFREFEG